VYFENELKNHLPRTISAVVLVALSSLYGCGGGGDSAGGGDAGTSGGAAARKFDSFASWLEASKPASPGGTHQVVFVGIDGASWRIIDPMIKRGKLPNFARIKKEGAWGALRSTPCFMSPPAWASLTTGYLPEKTGIYTFGQWNAESQDFGQITAADIRVPSAWDVASQAGMKVAVTNVPLTYPVHPVNGIMVSGLMTPVPLALGLGLGATNYTGDIGLEQVAHGLQSFSKPAKTEGSDQFNTLAWWRIDSTNDNEVNYDRVVLLVLSRPDAKFEKAEEQILVFDVGEYSPWFQVKAIWKDAVHEGYCKLKVFQRSDGRFESRSTQVLFDPRKRVAQYTYPAELADELSSKFVYYMPSKFLEKESVPAVTVEAAKYASFFYDYDDWDLFYYVFTQTDNIQHLTGFSDRAKEVYKIIDRFLGDLMDRLPEESTLIIGSDHGFKKYEWGIDVNEYFEQLGLLTRKDDGKEIDYDRTMVFHNMWHLYFNRDYITRENLEAIGVEVGPSQDPVDAMVALLDNRQITSADGKSVYPLTYYPLSGDYVGDGPDMLLEGDYGNYSPEFWNLKRPRGKVAWHLSVTEAHQHERDGIFMVWGKHVREGYDAGSHEIVDIAPTVLYLLGLPAAADMDGRAMLGVFRGEYTDGREFYEVPDYGEIPREFIAVEEDTESLEKKLKALGYVQ
jgi:predicted AlkP superfamily phosphohydrolase/phosphomutase